MFLDNIGIIRIGAAPLKQVSGVYIFTHKTTNSKYVGLSSQLSRRLIGYFKNTHKLTGKFLPYPTLGGYRRVPKGTGGYRRVPEGTEGYRRVPGVEYNLYTLKVVNSIYSAKNKPLYLYTKDYRKLIYYSDIQEDFIYKLHVHYNTFSKGRRAFLDTNAFYLDKYAFTSKPVAFAHIINMSLVEINDMLDKDRLKINNRPVVLVSVKDNNTLQFNSIKDCVIYLNTIKPANKTTLYRRINSEIAYSGYIGLFLPGAAPRPVNKNKIINILGAL